VLVSWQLQAWVLVHIAMQLMSCENTCFVNLLCTQVPVTVVYLDRSGAAALSGPGGSDAELDVTIHEIVPESCQQPESAVKMRVHVLYRPGHYDILYVRQPEASK
jgi:hypothetical protein